MPETAKLASSFSKISRTYIPWITFREREEIKVRWEGKLKVYKKCRILSAKLLKFQ
jgi:hypothetical protein